MAKKAASPKKLDSKKTPKKSSVPSKLATKSAPPAKVQPKKSGPPISKPSLKPEIKPTSKSNLKPAAKPIAKPQAKLKKEAERLSLKPATMSVAVAKGSKSPGLKVNGGKQATENTDKIKIDREAMTEEQVKWAEMYNKHKEIQAPPYDMKSTFQAGVPIQHKVLGWGWVVSNDNDRLEVLFKDGKRMLISNYRG